MEEAPQGDGSGLGPEELLAKVAAESASDERQHLSLPELGEKVAAEIGIDEAKAVRAVRMVQQEFSQEYSGPIPSALELSRLNEVCPNLGNDIARDFLAHRSHERSMDLQFVDLAKSDSTRKDGWLRYARRGQTYGMVSQLVFVGAALGAAYFHQVALACLLVAAPALGVIAQFIKGAAGQEASVTPEKSSNKIASADTQSK